MSVLHDDLLGPVGEHRVAVLHAARHRRRQDLEGLPHHAARLDGVGLQEAVEYLLETEETACNLFLTIVICTLYDLRCKPTI